MLFVPSSCLWWARSRRAPVFHRDIDQSKRPQGHSKCATGRGDGQRVVWGIVNDFISLRDTRNWSFNFRQPQFGTAKAIKYY